MIENRTTASSRPPGPCRFSMVFRNCALISFWKIISLKLAAAEAERYALNILNH